MNDSEDKYIFFNVKITLLIEHLDNYKLQTASRVASTEPHQKKDHCG